MPKKPLEGIKVLELARVLAGPWCGQLLADLGADVVKVERAKTGDDTREWGPPFVPDHEGNSIGSAYFISANRGKRGVEADFESEEGRALVRKLVTHADVVIENFKVGGLKKYGLDYESLKPLNPRLVYCSITGFGQDGPYASRAGYDFLIQGMGGLMALTGPVEGPPMKSAIAVTDVLTGLYAANAIQAALIQRERTGEGAYIDCCLLDTQVALLGNQGMNYLVSGKEPARMGNGHTSIVPYDVYATSDGHIIIATGNDGQYRRLVQVLGAPELADDPDYRQNRDRLKNRVVLTRKLNELTSRFTRADLLPQLEAVGVPAGPINTISEVFADPQVIARGLRTDVAQPLAASGSIPALPAPIVMDGERLASPLPSPALGQHMDEVLSDRAWGGAREPSA